MPYYNTTTLLTTCSSRCQQKETHMNQVTTQICTSCTKEKPFSEFHSRGSGYQKICKQCRNEGARSDYAERGKSRKPQSPVQINPNNFPALAERITKLDSKLRASAISYAHDKLDADDIHSE